MAFLENPLFALFPAKIQDLADPEALLVKKKFGISCTSSKVPFSKNIHNIPQSRIYAGKSAKRGFSKKALTEIEFFFVFRFERIPRRSGTLNQSGQFFHLLKTYTTSVMEDQITTEEMFARFPKLRIKIHILIPRFSQRIYWSRKILKVRQLSK